MGGFGKEHSQFDLESFTQDFRSFTGNSKFIYTFEDILLEEEELDDCYDDSTVSRVSQDEYIALLYVPLKPKSHYILVLTFGFIEIENNHYSVKLSDEFLVI